jgi:hypothetical protein
MSEWVLKTLRKFEDFQAEYEGSIPFTRSNKLLPAIQGFLELSGNIFDLFRVPQAIANWSAKNLAFTSVTIRSGVGYKPLPVGPCDMLGT